MSMYVDVYVNVWYACRLCTRMYVYVHACMYTCNCSVENFFIHSRACVSKYVCMYIYTHIRRTSAGRWRHRQHSRALTAPNTRLSQQLLKRYYTWKAIWRMYCMLPKGAYVCIYVCMYVSLLKDVLHAPQRCVCMYICMYVCKPFEGCTACSPKVRIYVYVYIYIYICVYIYIFVYAAFSATSQTLLYKESLLKDVRHALQRCVCVYIYIYVCMYVSVCIHGFLSRF